MDKVATRISIIAGILTIITVPIVVLQVIDPPSPTRILTCPDGTELQDGVCIESQIDLQILSESNTLQLIQRCAASSLDNQLIIADFCAARGDLQCTDWCYRFILGTEGIHPDQWAEAKKGQADILVDVGGAKNAITIYEEILAKDEEMSLNDNSTSDIGVINRNGKNETILTQTLIGLGNAWKLLDPSTAMEYYSGALNTTTNNPLLHLPMSAHNGLGSTYLLMDENEKAKLEVTKSLDIYDLSVVKTNPMERSLI